jgi:hypothetical protein
VVGGIVPIELRCGDPVAPRPKGGTMESFAFVFPVLPGKAEEARMFGKEVNGPRASEMDASRRPLGVTREAVWVNETPMGDMGIVLIEGENVAEANRRFAASTEPFDVWFKETVLDFSGVDFSHPLPAMSEVLYDNRA